MISQRLHLTQKIIFTSASHLSNISISIILIFCKNNSYFLNHKIYNKYNFKYQIKILNLKYYKL